MRNLTFILTIISVLILFSCKKKSDPTPAPIDPSTSRVKSMTFTDSIGNLVATMAFQYNNLGQLIEMHQLQYAGGTSMHFYYQYLPGTIIEIIYDTNNVLNARTAYSINSQKLITNGDQISYTASGDSMLMYVYSFKYNQDGYLIESKDFYQGDTSRYHLQTWEISSGNSISYSVLFSESGLTYTEINEYYNSTVNTIGNENLGRSFLGKSSVNLIKSSTIPNNPFGSKSYTYEFDSQNRVVKSSITQSNVIFNIAYAYY